MANFATTLQVPFTVIEYGTIRIADSRVSLDSVLHHFKLGAPAEQIALSFPTLKLADIYTAIAFYLNHRDKVEEYLRRQEVEADTLQNQMEADPERQAGVTELRERIQARWIALQERNTPAG